MKTCACKDTMIIWQIRNKMKNQKYGTSEAVLKSKREIVETG